MDKVYKRKNLALAWQRVKRNKGAGGIDGVTLAEFEEHLEVHLDRLHEELRTDTYQPMPVRQKLIPKAGQPGKYRPLGIPAIYDRVCQQALQNRLEPIFEAVFDDASFGYRPGRSTKDALRRIWNEIEAGFEWIVDADLSNFFGTVDHDKLLALVAQRISDGRVLRLIGSMLTADSLVDGKRLPTAQGTPQGGVISPILSNVLLTPFDREMRHRGYRVTRYADDWVVTCHTRRDAERVLQEATTILTSLGVTLNREKTRIVHVTHGFEFLGYKIKRGTRPLQLSPEKIRSGARTGALYAIPRQKSVEHFKDQIRRRTRRKASVSTQQLVAEINPVIRGWGLHYSKAHVRKLFNQLDRWIVQRLWSQHHRRWRCAGWKTLPRSRLYGEFGLVNLVSLIPSMARQ
ncbi:MAG: group II intron reverse transcriptase/maturase [Planctomycetota bacterium]|nr:group II intron reverse transcriptase/maturase [Planctomycetota bacterium]